MTGHSRDATLDLGLPAGLPKSSFPFFDVDVPMPKDTAVPGSYWASRPGQAVDDGEGDA